MSKYRINEDCVPENGDETVTECPSLLRGGLQTSGCGVSTGEGGPMEEAPRAQALEHQQGLEAGREERGHSGKGPVMRTGMGCSVVWACLGD